MGSWKARKEQTSRAAASKCFFTLLRCLLQDKNQNASGLSNIYLSILMKTLSQKKLHPTKICQTCLSTGTMASLFFSSLVASKAMNESNILIENHLAACICCNLRIYTVNTTSSNVAKLSKFQTQDQLNSMDPN